MGNFAGIDNFDSDTDGDVNGQTGGSGWSAGWVSATGNYEVQGSQTNYGSYKALFTDDCATEPTCYRMLTDTSTNAGDMYFSIRKDLVGADNWGFVACSGGVLGNARAFQIFMQFDGTLIFQGTSTETLDASYDGNTWYDIHVNWTSATTVKARIKVSGTSTWSAYTSEVTLLNSKNTIDRIVLETANAGSGNASCYIDNISDTEPTVYNGAVTTRNTLNTGLVAYFRFEEESGNRIDSWAGLTLTDVGSLGYGAGIIGNAADFNRSAPDFLESAQDAFGLSSDISVSTWVKFESLPTSGNMFIIFNKENESGQDFSTYMGSLYNDTGTLKLFFRTTNGSVSSNIDDTVDWTPSTGTWYHLVFTRKSSGGTIKFYVNGAQQGASQEGYDGTLSDSLSYSFFLSYYKAADPRAFDGLIDEFGLWSKVLDINEVLALYNGGDGLPFTPDDVSNDAVLPIDLQAYWTLDEYSAGSTGVARNDSTSNGNDLDSDTNNVPSIAAVIDNGADFTRASTQYLATGGGEVDITGDRASSLWVYIKTAPDDQEYALDSKYTDGGNQRSWLATYVDSSGTKSIIVRTSDNGADVQTDNYVKTLTPETWYHIVFNYDASAGTCQIWINGVLEDTLAGLDTSLHSSTGPYTLGWNTAVTGYADAVFDEYGIWERLLTAGQIKGLYNDGDATPYDGITSSIKSIDGLAYASIKSVNGLAVASMKSFNGLE